jgi:hypothetical protein
MQNHERQRTTNRILSHGLSDEEKEKTCDKFELHLELGDLRNVAAVLIAFFAPKTGSTNISSRADYRPKVNSLRSY